MAGRADGGSPSGRSPSEGPETLTPEDHRALAYASALGSEFEFRLLREAMGVEEEALAEQLEGLIRQGFLRERSGGERFGFVEEEVRARVYRSLTESRLRVLHRKIAEVLERLEPNPGPQVLSELGRHYFLGKVPEKSFGYNRRAAELARAADNPTAAVSHLERALIDLAGLPGDHRQEHAEVAEELGDLCYATSSFRAADRFYQEALQQVSQEQPRIRARLLLARAEIARENLDGDAAIDGAGAALTLFQAANDGVGCARAYRLLGRVAFQRGAYRDALDESMRALDALPADAPPRLLGRLSIDIGNAFALLGAEVRPVAIEWYERAARRLRQVRDWAELARALHNLGVAIGETRPQDGLDYLERARDSAAQAHDSRAMGRALLSGVEMRLALGQIDEAERDNEQSGRLLDRLSDLLGLQQVALNRGMIGEKRGQWEDAERAYRSAASIAREHRLAADEAEAEFHLARIRYKTHNLDGARESFARATELGLSDLVPRLGSAYRDLKSDLDTARSGASSVPQEEAPTEGADGRTL